jgi:hypothetical protein
MSILYEAFLEGWTQSGEGHNAEYVRPTVDLDKELLAAFEKWREAKGL